MLFLPGRNNTLSYAPGRAYFFYRERQGFYLTLGASQVSVLTRIEARITTMETELTALSAQDTSRGGVVEFSIGGQRVRYESTAALERRLLWLRNNIETDKCRVVRLGGTL